MLGWQFKLRPDPPTLTVPQPHMCNLNHPDKLWFGATASCLSRSLLSDAKLSSLDSQAYHPHHVLTINRDDVQVFGSITRMVQFGDQLHAHWFLVTTLPWPLLGLDFLHDHHATIDAALNSSPASVLQVAYSRPTNHNTTQSQCQVYHLTAISTGLSKRKISQDQTVSPSAPFCPARPPSAMNPQQQFPKEDSGLSSSTRQLSALNLQQKVFEELLYHCPGLCNCSSWCLFQRAPQAHTAWQGWMPLSTVSRKSLPTWSAWAFQRPNWSTSSSMSWRQLVNPCGPRTDNWTRAV